MCLRNDLFLLFFSPVNIITLNYLLKNCVGALLKVCNEHNRHIHAEVPFTAIGVEMSVRGI